MVQILQGALLAILMLTALPSKSTAQAPSFMLERREELLEKVIVPYRGPDPSLSTLSNTINQMVVACLFQGRVNLSQISSLKRQIEELQTRKNLTSPEDAMTMSQLYVRLWEMEFTRCRLT